MSEVSTNPKTGPRPGSWPVLRQEPKPPALTEEERLRDDATKRADFLIRQLGPVAEILDAQNQEVTGLTLREMMIEKEHIKLKAQLEAKRLRQEHEAEARRERMEAAEREIVENWDDHYILTLGGKRIKKAPKDLGKLGCPSCGTPHNRIRGALIELWEWRGNHSGPGTTYESPVKSESLVCSKCGQSFSYRVQVII